MSGLFLYFLHKTMDPSQQASALERSALVVATLTSFMGPFMISSVNVALPVIQKDLGMNAVQLSWIATSYLLAVAVGLVPAGKIADIYGRKKVFATGLAVYTVGAVLAGCAGSAVMLIVLRMVQGLGAAMFVATGMAIISSIFPPARRGRVIGIYVAAVYVGLSTGPFAGGFLTQQYGWRSIFFLMLPLGLGSLWLTLRQLPGEWRGEAGQRLDFVGCLLYGATLLALVYGGSLLPATRGLLLSGTGIVLFFVFLHQQRQSRYPVFELALFTGNRTFAFSSLAALLNYSATFAVTFLISLYLQYIRGLTPQSAGALLMAQPVVMALFSPLAGRMVERIEPRLLATAGMSMTVIGVSLFSRLQPETPSYLIVSNLIFLGFGFALFSSPNMSAIMGAVEKRYYGVASGTVATMRLLGQMTSMAVATVVLSLFLGTQTIVPATHNLFLQSLRTVFVISSLLCLCGVYFSWFRGRMLEKE